MSRVWEPVSDFLNAAGSMVENTGQENQERA